jgi:hypothetical protein
MTSQYPTHRVHMTFQNAVSLRIAQTVQAEQTIEWHAPQPDVGLVNRVGVLHQEFIAPVDQIACSKLHRKLDAPRGRVEYFERGAAWTSSDFEVRFRRCPSEAIEILASASKALSKLPNCISESSLTVRLRQRFSEVCPFIHILASQFSQIRKFTPAFLGLHLGRKEAIPRAGAGMSLIELQRSERSKDTINLCLEGATFLEPPKDTGTDHEELNWAW